MKRLLLVLFLIGRFATSLLAQEFTIKSLETTSENLILYYDLIDTVKSRTYTVSVFSSKDNFLNPIQKVKGDVGLEVKPGGNRKIVWSSKEELGPAFRGELELEVRGRVYVPFVKFNDFQKGMVFKRGKATTLTWAGGNRQNILNFKLYQGDDLITVIPNVANSGSFDMVIPGSVKPRDSYYFIIADSKNKDQMMITPEFEVKRKVPLLVKIIPMAIVAGAVVYFLPKPAPTAVENPADPPGTTN